MSRVSRTSEHGATIACLWQEHLDAPFPARLRGAEPGGIDIVLLDATVAGCVSARQNKGGCLDAERNRILRDCVADLDQVLASTTEAEELRYFRRLRRLAALASDSGPRSTN
ncbi:hypothetical protein S1361_18530 [Streptomyces cyanogenus]|uniref:Uncharacterized protein n=1 Tax=Streptomyces cyanogenus TaxID=80860 RepID=A0ABX7TRK6_STRCY|nr:hypothetical protein S1361_18530 [Streptomyces cyanogenus]